MTQLQSQLKQHKDKLSQEPRFTPVQYVSSRTKDNWKSWQV